MAARALRADSTLSPTLWAATGLQISCTELYWDVLGCIGLYWAVMDCSGMVRVDRMISVDDMHSENILYSWSNPSNYREQLRGKWKIVQYSGRLETTTAFPNQGLLVG